MSLFSSGVGVLFLIAIITIGCVAVAGNMAVIASVFIGERQKIRKTVLGYVKASLAMADLSTGNMCSIVRPST